MPSASETPAIAVNPPVFFTSAVLLVAFVAFGVLASDTAGRALPAILDAVSTNFGWLYVSAVTGFIVFCLWLLSSRYASIRLGDDDERPGFSTLSWFSMLFSAGMGIGLVFYGVAEPMLHYASLPGVAGGTAAAAARALPTTFFHWGIHAWSIYALMGLGIAYFAFRRKLPLALRSCFYPLLGARIDGLPGHAVDVLAVFGTLFGLATSLGLGAMQVSAGLHHLFETPHTTQTQLLLIAIITAAATASLVTGVNRGIRRLSELNMLLAGLLLLFVLSVGPTRFIVGSFVENLGRYLVEVFNRTVDVGTLDPRRAAWSHSWTLFYWGWWIAWAPFVGMFIARISRGRTIREFVLGVLLVPTGVTFLWITTFGGTALHLELGGAGIAAAVSSDVSTAVYVMLEKLPLASITSLLTAGVVSVFFVTSSDSGSLVVDMLTSGGHPNPPVWQRVFWAIAEGACAAVLLRSGGERSLSALQAAVVSVGLPFCLVLVALAISLRRALREDPALGTSASAVSPTASQAASPNAPQEVPMKLERILVPVDYSNPALHAVEHAVQLADLVEDETRIDVLHVALRPADYLPLDVWIWGEERDQHQVDEAVRKAAGAALDEFVAALPEQVRERIHPRLEIGLPSQRILEAVRREGYDVVVMGTHGRTGAERATVGSVTERVIRRSPCPVITVR